MADDLQTGKTTYNAFIQMITTVNGDRAIIYTYDANGNFISDHGGNADKTYTYDADK